MTSGNHEEPESEGSSDSVDDNQNNDSQGKNILQPSENYEKECSDIIEDVFNATLDLLGVLMEKEQLQGCKLIKKVTGFATAILKSNQKLAGLEEACTHHDEKSLKPIKVIKTCWNSHCNAFEHHLSIIGGATCICTATKYKHLWLKKFTLSGLKQMLPMLKVSLISFAIPFVILFTHDELTTCMCIGWIMGLGKPTGFATWVWWVQGVQC